MEQEPVESRGDNWSVEGVSTPTVDEVYREHAPLLRGIATQRFSIPSTDADTLVHDVFIDYLARPERIRTNLRGYLVGSICNASRNYWRAKHSERRVFNLDVELEDRPAERKDPTDGLADTQLASEVLGRLGWKCRELLRRYYMEGEKTESIAAAFGTSPANIHYLMHICRKNARAAYHEIANIGRAR